MRCYLTWCAGHNLDPLAAQRLHLELYIRWKQETRRFKPSTVSRRFSVTAGFYRTCAIDGVLEHSPAEHVRRPKVATESPTLGFTHLQTEVGAYAWAFQECTGWRAAGGHGFFTAERILDMRGFGVPSSHHGCDPTVFVRESAGLRVIAERHEQGRRYWHAVAGVAVATPWPGSSLHLVSTHLAPSPSIRLSEAETLAPMAKDGWVIAGGDWHALSATDPEPPLDGIDRAEARRTLDRSAAFTLEEAGFTDVGAHLEDLRPTVGHARGLRYRRDRLYTTTDSSLRELPGRYRIRAIV